MDILSDVNIVGILGVRNILYSRILGVGETSNYIWINPLKDSSKPLSSTNISHIYQFGEIGMVVRKTIDIPIGCSVFELFIDNGNKPPLIQTYQVVGQFQNSYYKFDKIEVDVYNDYSNNGNGTEFYLGKIVPRTSEIKIMALAHY